MSRLPNLVIAGAPKAGTTSLFEYLGQHPAVFPAPIKQTAFFKQPVDEAGLAGYRELFRHATDEPIVMEATPGYLARGREVAERIDATLDAARVIVSLREPVARLRSHHAMLLRAGTLEEADRDFASFVRALATGEPPDARLEGLDRANRYGPLVRAWGEVFGERLRVVFFDDLVRDPRGLTRDLCGWLGIDPDVCDRFDYAARNRRARYRSAGLARAARRLGRAAGPLLGRSPRVKGVLRRLHGRVNSRPLDEDGATDAATLEALRARYAGSNAELSAWLRAAGYTALPAWLSQPRIGAPT